MLRKIIFMLMLISSTEVDAQVYSRAKHNEVLTQQYGHVHFVSMMGYPIMPATMAFMGQVREVSRLQSSTYIRNFTQSELQSFINGKNPYQDKIDDIPEDILNDMEGWQKRQIANLKGFSFGELADGTLAQKYNVDTSEDASFLYFAPSGNLYYFSMPVWRSEPSFAEFWNVLKRETRFNPQRRNIWAEANDKREKEQQEQGKRKLFSE